LAGGDANRGKQLFLTKSSVMCVRCHKLQGEGGEVGPELAGIGAKQTREYLLESMVLPDKQIAHGFDTVVLDMADGKTITGVFKSETPKIITLATTEGTVLHVDKSKVEDRRRGPSAMPADLAQKLTPRELRDLIEFLTSLKQ
jgi:quinoprotein glucose dehydrogenase